MKACLEDLDAVLDPVLGESLDAALGAGPRLRLAGDLARRSSENRSHLYKSFCVAVCTAAL